MSEVFGFPIDNQEAEAIRHRDNRLCPFNNRVPNCTKDKVDDPLGVCSVYHHERVTVTCPVRFRENWIIADDAAEFFFPPDANWTSIREVRLYNSEGVSAGNIDLVLVQYDDNGRILDFGSVEIQAVYISGNIRRPFEYYMQDSAGRANMDWRGQANYPGPDFLSSSRKRLAPQLIFKGGILYAWGKKQAVVIDTEFFNTLPRMEVVSEEEAEIAWLIYELRKANGENRFHLTKVDTVYTKFEAAMEVMSKTQAGNVEDFVQRLQTKLRKLGIRTAKKEDLLLDLE